jgi:hypothetical protein
MSTHSLTLVKDNYDNTLVVLYGQYDGYPDGYGKDLYDFLSDVFITNGLVVGSSKENVANGAGCLAAQLVCNFKTEPGGFYLANESQDWGEDYKYTITVLGTGEAPFHIKVQNDDGKEIFSGNIKEFGEFCKDYI